MADAESQLARGIALARTGQKEEAYLVLRRALFAEGDDANLRVWLGAVAPNLNEALAHLERAVELAPNNPQALGGLAWVREQLAAAPPPPPPTPIFAQPPPTYAPPPSPAPTPRMAARPLEDIGPALPGGDSHACPNCGMPARPGDRFCLRCGRALDTTAPGAEGGAAATADDGMRTIRMGMRTAGGNAATGANEPAPLAMTIAPPPAGRIPGRPLEPTSVPFAPHPTMPGAAKPARRNRLRTIVLGGLGVLIVLGVVGAIAVYTLTIQPAQQATANATATADTAIAQVTASVVVAATQEAVTTATAVREATVAVRPTLTAKAATDTYFRQVAEIMQQVATQDNDLTQTLNDVRAGNLEYNNALDQFAHYADLSYEVKDRLTKLSVPGDQHVQHQSMADALAARSRAIVAGKQLIGDLIQLAYDQARADQAQQVLNTARTKCAQTGKPADCGQAGLAQNTYNQALEQVRIDQGYADQDSQQFTQNWDQYKQLMPGATTGGDQ